MPIRTSEPRQNEHRWTGILKTAGRHVFGNCTLKNGDKLIFVKTSSDAHFIAEGTYISKLIVLSESGDPREAVRNISADRKIPRAVLGKILKELQDDFGQNLPIVEILEIDSDNTPPLTKILNSVTRGLFSDDDWLKDKEIGIDDIKIGRALFPLPFKRTRGILVKKNSKANAV